jgi:hypothetical protein
MRHKDQSRIGRSFNLKVCAKIICDNIVIRDTLQGAPTDLGRRVLEVHHFEALQGGVCGNQLVEVAPRACRRKEAMHEHNRELRQHHNVNSRNAQTARPKQRSLALEKKLIVIDESHEPSTDVCEVTPRRTPDLPR